MMNFLTDPQKILAGLCSGLVVCLALLGWRYEAVIAEYAEFKVRVFADGKRAAEAQQAAQKAREDAVKQVRSEYEEILKKERDRAAVAVANLRRVHQDASGGDGVCGTAAGHPVADGTKSESVLTRTLGNCAEDAAKLTAWQNWCKTSGCVVKD
jgi:hypothetical protein